MRRITAWVRANRYEALLLVAILFLAAIFRFWRIDEYLPFLGDEGRDVRVVRRFLVDFDLMLIGPRTSIGDMYLGPLYYYLIAPALVLFRLSPTGPASLVALLSTATVGLVWYIGREWFGKVAALVGAGLFAVSPVVIQLSKHSWNPNIMPFFSLVSVYAIWRVWQKKEFKWLLVLGVAYAFVLQSHYLGLLLVPTLGLVWLAALLKRSNGKWKTLGLSSGRRLENGNFLRYSLLASVIFAALMSPLVIFDARHGWRNFAAMEKFFSQRQTTVSAKPWNAIPQLWPIWSENLIERIIAGKNEKAGPLVAVALAASALFILLKRKTPQFLLLAGWIFFGLVGLGVYKQSIFDHYFGFMFAAPFLLIGTVSQELWQKKQWIVIVLVIGLAWVNLQENPLLHPPQRQMQRVQAIDRKIIEESRGQPFNFALIAKRNYEEGHLYFFELWGTPVREIDAQRVDETLTEQLFVVCEDSPSSENPEPCNPINHPKAEIANFGWAKIEDEWEISGVKLFKLVHTDEQEN